MTKQQLLDWLAPFTGEIRLMVANQDGQLQNVTDVHYGLRKGEGIAVLHVEPNRVYGRLDERRP